MAIEQRNFTPGKAEILEAIDTGFAAVVANFGDHPEMPRTLKTIHTEVEKARKFVEENL